MKIKSSKKGITLVALVITIIVLLILAGITISVLVGKNSILVKADIATEKTQVATYIEKIRIIHTEIIIERTTTEVKESLKSQLVKKFKSEELQDWVAEVKTTIEDESIQENEIVIVTNDFYRFVIKINDEAIEIEYTGKEDGEPYPTLTLERMPVEGIANEKPRIKAIAQVEKKRETTGVSKIVNVETGEEKEYVEGGVVFEVPTSGKYYFRAETNKNKTRTKSINIDVYELKYDGTGGNNIPDNQIKIKDMEVSISAKIPTKTGYIFKGWSTQKEGTVEYQSGESYTKNENVTLYAVWEIQKYEIQYDLNGGSGTIEKQIKEHGKTLILTTQKPTKSGYGFAGWSTTLNGGVSYQAGAGYGGNTNTTLYAVWQKLYTLASQVSLGDYVSYSANGYSSWRVLSKSGDTVKIISAGSPTTTTLSGMSGWNDSAYYLNSVASRYYNSDYVESNNSSNVRSVGSTSSGGIYDTGNTFTQSLPDVTEMKNANLITPPDNKTYWLAARYLFKYSDGINRHYDQYRVMARSSGPDTETLSYGVNNDRAYSYGVRPVIKLKSGLNTTGKSGNVWQLTTL